MPRALHIVEPALVKDSGHFPSLVRAIRAIAAPHFDSIHLWAHHQARLDIPGTRLIPFFRRRVRRYQVAWLVARHTRPGETILFSTAHASDFRGVRWARAATPADTRRFIFFVHMHYPHARHDATYRDAARRSPGFEIAAPTPACAEAMRALGFPRVTLVPYPHEPVTPRDPGPAAADREGPAFLLLPGVPRMDKGLLAIARLAESLAADGATIPLRVQRSPDHWGQLDHAAAQALSRLEGSRYTGLAFIEGNPAPPEYAAQFRGAIALQPYDPTLFRDRISGVTLDALRATCPVIVSQGTWMARVVERHGAGVTLPDHEPATLRRAIDRVLADLPAFRAAAADAARALDLEQAQSPLASLLRP